MGSKDDEHLSTGGMTRPPFSTGGEIKWPDHFKKEDIEAFIYSASAMAHNIKRLADAAEKQAKYQKDTIVILRKIAAEMKK